MPNPHQMEYLIKEATERVAVPGSDLKPSDIMLAGFGYIAHEINKSQWNSFKRVLPVVFTTVLAVSIGIAESLVRLFR